MRLRVPAAEPGTPSAGGDIVPLSRRVAVMCVLRAAGCIAVVTIGFVSGRLQSVPDLSGPLLYLLAGTAISGIVVGIPHRPTSVGVFGLMLCLDGVAVVVAQQILGSALGGDLILAVFLTAVCLLASFRTGVKLAFWQSLILVIHDRGGKTGLFPPNPAEDSHRLIAELILLWMLVIVTCGAAAVNERELRRRRYDAEAFQSFASSLHQDESSDRVIRRTIDFFVAELDAARVLVCRSTDSGLQVVGGRGLASGRPPQQRRAVPQASGQSLLDIAGHAGQPARLLHLDQARDPWLAAQLPSAHRLIVVPLATHATNTEHDRIWIVFEHEGQGVRLERRIFATAGQAGATAGLALSRAMLFERSKAAALTDALTGLSNRRSLDDRLAQLRAAGADYALMLADVDHFKAVNDTHGHQVGDEVLQQVAAALAGAAPAGAIVARYGGEEFAVVLTTGLNEASDAAERLRLAVAGIVTPVPVTASFGVSFATGGVDTAEVIAGADARLYQAKAAGRNQVILTG